MVRRSTQDTGIRNIKALSSVLEMHKLPYAFPYSEFEFDTDLNAVILSQGKSFLPFDIQCPLQPSDSNADLYSDSLPPRSTKLNLELRKRYSTLEALQPPKPSKFPKASASISKRSFVTSEERSRKKRRTRTVEAREKVRLGRRICCEEWQLFRLLALSHGERASRTRCGTRRLSWITVVAACGRDTATAAASASVAAAASVSR